MRRSSSEVGRRVCPYHVLNSLTRCLRVRAQNLHWKKAMTLMLLFQWSIARPSIGFHASTTAPQLFWAVSKCCSAFASFSLLAVSRVSRRLHRVACMSIPKEDFLLV